MYKSSTAVHTEKRKVNRVHECSVLCGGKGVADLLVFGPVLDLALSV